MVSASSFTRHYLKKTFIPIQSGFTLIELLVVVVMLSVLLIGLIFTFNPVAQINKSKDLQREHDLEQVKAALDTYYNDKGCYPTSLNFGSAWASGQNIYMTKVPQDPDYISGSTTNLSYIYQTDGTSCPQWNVLYSGLKGAISSSTTCPLSQRTSCVPQGFNTYYNFCLSSGTVDCSVISSSSLSSGGNIGGGGGGGNNVPTPTPTSGPIVCPGENYYGCSSDDRCNSENPKEGNCIGYGGATQCYCDQLCRVNGVKQCAN